MLRLFKMQKKLKLMYSAIYPVCKINYPQTYLYRCEHLQKNFAYKKKALYIVYKK